MSCPKYFLFTVNLVVWISSVVILGMALYVYLNIKGIINIFPNMELQMVPIPLIVAGCTLFIISFSGCCGAIKGWKWMLCMYLGFLLLIIGAQAYITYVIMKFRSDGTHLEKVKHWVDTGFQKHKENNFWAFEELFHCCGSNGAGDYVLERIPARCCDKPASNTCLAKDAYAGCGKVFSDFIEKYSKYGGYGMIAVGVVELLAVIAALFMICKKTNSFQRV